MQRILVVEDDWELNKNICYMLKKEGYEVLEAHSIVEAKEIYAKNQIQLILLDVNLPDGDGFTFCNWVKAKNKAPVIFLTARDLEEDALKGYTLGAEDYVVKPFSMKILIKRIDVVLKHNRVRATQVFSDDFLQIDFIKAKVEVKGKDCPVTPTEIRLLKTFIENRGRMLTYEILLEQLWENEGQFVDKHTLAVNVSRLRGKIEDEKHRYILNVYGMGYQWAE